MKTDCGCQDCAEDRIRQLLKELNGQGLQNVRA